MASSSSTTPSSKQHGVESKPFGETPLQKHVAFFDRNHDGLIYPSETYQGFRALGSGVLFSAVAAAFINVGLSRKTRPGKPFSIRFPIEVKNIHLARHGSDTGAYDSKGRFVPEKFDEIFAKHARTNPEALTAEELNVLLKANREPKDFNGWLSAFLEWKFLHHIAKDKNGLLQKETVRGVYDGSLFELLEKERSQAKRKVQS